MIILDTMGNAVETIYGSLINGPWDMIASDDDNQAKLFVTNVLNGTQAEKGSVVNQGTVIRINHNASEKNMPVVESLTVIAAGFPERTDPGAVVIGPTGEDLSPRCADRDDDDCTAPFGEDEPVLYVADSLNNRIVVIPDASTRTTSAGSGKTLSAGG